MIEPDITINGQPLTQGQVMAVRAAIGAFLFELEDPLALGSDEHGIRMVKAYKERLAEVTQFMEIRS